MYCENCYKCYEVQIPECPSQILVNAGLEANKIYYVTITDKFGEQYKQQCTSDNNGSILLLISGLPSGSLNRYSGNWKIEVRKVLANCEPELLQFCCDGVVKTFSCIIASFFQSSLGSLPTDIGCLCNDPITPAHPSTDDSIEVPFSEQETITYTHNLGRYVDVTIYDTDGIQIYGQVIQDSLNQITVNFNQSLSGTILID